MTYTTKTFEIPSLLDISEKQIKVHLGLYDGYVKHTNLIMEKVKSLKVADATGNAYIISELRRRFAFEFNGMRMHEYYFEQFEKGGAPIDRGSVFDKISSEKYGDQGIVPHIKEVASSRGIGWVVVYADINEETIHTVFVGDHELGQLTGLNVLLALDLWEHAFMVDYMPAQKKDYVDAFFANLNWGVVEKRFNDAMKMIKA